MNKKKIVISVIVVLLFIILLIAGKLFYSWWLEEKYLGYVPTNEFTIEETESKKIIKHKGTKLKIEIPVDWQIKKTETSLFLATSDFQPSPETNNYNFYVLEKGCIIETNVIREKESEPYNIWYGDTQARIQSCLKFPEKNKEDYSEEIIEVSGHNALKNVYSSEEDHLKDPSIPIGKHISIKIPKNENIYIFEIYLFSKDKERCEQEFDKLLKTVVIE